MSGNDGPMTILGVPRGALGAATAYTVALFGAGGVLAARSRRPDPDLYQRFEQAPFAPPAAAFGPAWTVIKLADGWALARLAGDDTTTEPADAAPFPDDDGPVLGSGADAGRNDRRLAIAAAALNDVLYIAFPLVYFRGRSPVLGAVVTTATAVTALVQLDATRRFDRPAALALIPRLSWLALATPVAVYQALHNEDPLLGTPRLIG